MNDIPVNTRVILADDHEVFRMGLKAVLTIKAQAEIVGEANNGSDVLAVLSTNPCDLLILDLKLPNLSGMALLPIITKNYPKVKIMVLTVFNDAEHARAALKAGAHAYLLKTDSVPIILDAINHLLTGKTYLSPSLMADTLKHYLVHSYEETPLLDILSKRERQVYLLLVSGKTNKQIAETLHLSIRTVEAHRANVYRKLNVNSVSEVVKLAYKLGTVT